MDVVLGEQEIVYYGFRAEDSLSVHERFGKKYPFKFPSKTAYMLINIIRQDPKTQPKRSSYIGTPDKHKGDSYIFDSCFESGNLDIAAKVKENEYDLYIRDDSNARGHHQWFYFSVEARQSGVVKLNIVNFSRRDSLYGQGMRVAVYSVKKAELASKGELPEVYSAWHRDGNNVTYKYSKLSQELYQRAKIMYNFYKAQ